MSFRFVSVLPLLALLLRGTVAGAQAPSAADSAGVRAALDHYLRAHATGSPAEAQLAFGPGAALWAMRDGKLWTLDATTYALRFSGAPAKDEPQRKRRVDFLDIRGTAAVARITLDYPEVTFTDYMSLLKVGTEWKIVAKTFHADPKTPNAK